MRGRDVEARATVLHFHRGGPDRSWEGPAHGPWPAWWGPASRRRGLAGRGTGECGQREETGPETGPCLSVTPCVLRSELQGRRSHCHFTITIGRAGPKRGCGKGLAPARRWPSPGSRSSVECTAPLAMGAPLAMPVPYGDTVWHLASRSLLEHALGEARDKPCWRGPVTRRTQGTAGVLNPSRLPTVVLQSLLPRRYNEANRFM